MNNRLELVMQHPLHRFLGVGDIEVAAGKSAFCVDIGEQLVNPAGVLHGGAVYVLCDVCAYAALLSLMDDQTEAVTHDIHVSVMRPASHGQRVNFTAEVIRTGRSLSFINVEAAVEGRVIATARVTKSMITRS